MDKIFTLYKGKNLSDSGVEIVVLREVENLLRYIEHLSWSTRTREPMKSFMKDLSHCITILDDQF